jgi:hypothetical protein
MTNRNGFADAGWRKSSYSASSGECIEIATTTAMFAIRDSKNTSGPLLTLTSEHGLSFLTALKSGRFNR